jgi:hypothetical protein
MGRRRNGTSTASSHPSGTIQNPSTGKKPRSPPTMNRSAIEIRAQRVPVTIQRNHRSSHSGK